MTDKSTVPDGDTADVLTDPIEHAEAYDSVEPGQDVSEPEVPADVEIAARSADMDTPSETHTKSFVLGPSPLGGTKNPYTEANGYDHEPNKAATRQGAINAGLWPTGEAAFKSAKKHPDGESWVLTYTVPVIVAHDAQDGSQTPRVVAADGDAEGATNYSPPADVAEHEDNTTE
jgi:hypothetical protein